MPVEKQVSITYESCSYNQDDGLWTVQRITKADIAKVFSSFEAQALIDKLKKADKN